jgi:serralysin
VHNPYVGEFASWTYSSAAKVVGDFNGDGRTDIALTTITGSWSSIPVAFSNGNGTFAITNAPVANFPQWAASTWVTPIGGRFR